MANKSGWDAWRKNKYKPEFCEIAFDILAEGKTKAHVCRELKCSKTTLLDWMDDHEDFQHAIQSGLSEGESVFMDKIENKAWQPSRDVNNGLIKMLAASVYGIKDEPSTVVKVQQNNLNEEVTDKDLKDRGVPLPEMDVEDVDD